jgi:proprotein convertase subtilisin/kexin type 5
VGTSTACSACYIGYFLKNQQCVAICGNGYYSNSTDLTCNSCPSLCATCDIQKCFTCNIGSYFFDGICYAVCPSQAPNIYGLYCRNCLKTDCIKCNSQGSCTMCVPGTYNFNGDCAAACPSAYEPDFVTNSQCILKSDIAYFNYIKAL